MLTFETRFSRLSSFYTLIVTAFLSGCAPAVLSTTSHGPLTSASPADLETELREYVVQHRAEAKRGFYPDGTRLGVTCLLVNVKACLVDHFLMQRELADEIEAADFDTDTHLLIDVRGETERAGTPLPEHLAHYVVQYGFDIHDPLVLDELDREAFVDAIRDVRDDDPRPVALLCSVGVRSQAAAAVLRDAGMRDFVSIRGGLATQHPSLTKTN